MATAQPTTVSPEGVWHTLAAQLMFGNYVPVPTPDDLIEERTFVRRDGETYRVLKHRKRKTYLSLPPDAYALWQMMDGERPARSIAVAYALQYRQLVTGLLRGLVDELRAKGFLEDPPARVFSTLAARRMLRNPATWIPRLLGMVISTDLGELRQGDAVLGALYRTVGWPFFLWPVIALMTLLIVVGCGAWLVTMLQGHHSLFTVNGSFLLGVISLYLLDGLMTTFHEAGHGLAVKHHRREVISVGLNLYYGAPCAFVNTSDIWMANRGARIQVSLAGPFVTLVLAGVMGLVAYAAPAGSLTGDLAYKAATLWFIDGLFNSIPLLELDGYFVLVDWLEMPMLRARAFHFLHQDLWRKLRGRETWSREEKILGWFGVLAMVFSVLMLGLAFWGIQNRAGQAFAELWEMPGWYGKPLLALFVFVLAGPLVLGLVSMLWALLHWIFGHLTQALRERRLSHRAVPILDAIPYLKHLTPGERTALAQHLRTRRVPAGATVVRQGDAPDGFYVLRSGEADVVRKDARTGSDGESRRVAVLGPGDYFGELAYLNHAPRDATVRARTNLELLYLDGGHFHRWVAEDIRGRSEIVQRMLDQAMLERLPLFAGLTPSQRSPLLEHMGVEHYAADEVVFQQGDPGDRLFLVVKGRFQVLSHQTDETDTPADAPETLVAELGVGEIFGEIALLADAPRSATLRAIEPSVCYTLDREGFGRLLETAPANRLTLQQLAVQRQGATHPGHGTDLRDE